MSRKSSSIVLVLSLVFAATLLAGVVWHRTDANAAADGSAPYKQLNVMTEVYQHIADDYVTTPDLNKVGDGGLHGLVEALDPDSSFLNQTEYPQYLALQKQPPAGLSGAVISKRQGYADVVDVWPGSPAAQAGLVRGDFIEAVGNDSTRDLSLAAIDEKLEGAPGATVTVSAVHLHRSDPVKITITLAPLKPVPLSTSIQAGVGVVQVPDFNPGRAAQIASTVASLQKQGAAKFILDLRNCGAGSYDEAIQAANLFLNKGTITYLEGQKVPRVTSNADPAKAVAASQPVEVLINNGTAGPAELLTAALLDNDRGAVIGDHTFSGEGGVEKVVELGDGSAVLLTVARYYSPKAVALFNGIAPSVAQVQYAGALADEDFPAEGASPTQPDLQMQKALDLLHGKS